MKKVFGLLLVMLTVALLPCFATDLTWTKGQDGLSVFYPSTGWTWTEGSDGHRVVYPLSGWTWTESRNGRRVIFPISGWTWTEGNDGRRIVYPLSGWTWTEGRDGIRVAYPLSGWTWTEGRDGHRVVYPFSGWAWREDATGRRVVYPTSGDPWVRVEDLLFNELVSRIQLTEAQRPYLYLLLEQMGFDATGSAFDPQLSRAHFLLNNNEISAARDLFRSIARMGSGEYVRRDAAYMVGYCTANLNDYWQAIQEYQDFLAQYDRHDNERLIPDALYVLGVLNEHVGRKSSAADAYRNCISRFPSAQVAAQARERLKAIGYRDAARIAGSVGDSGVVLAPRRNPFESVKVDTAQIARVCQFVYSVEKLDGVKESLAQLTAADEQLETVQKYRRILREKRNFEKLHQN
ncbi:MAG TPA: hypothetical protein PLM07_10115 [Candidatus Rifleibacterium sp.]|nr:hypothetical protein [Candidatus Rifleibacterium sp.]HPT46243.1 hypothetical protein [Candidatus Rifleibacterium sp.]